MLEGIDTLVLWRWISSIILAALLFVPTKKFIFVQRVRKAERRLKRGDLVLMGGTGAGLSVSFALIRW